MDDNLFTCLFKYRETLDKTPLEDYFTEALAYLLRKDEDLAKHYLAFLLPDLMGSHECPISPIDICTQYVVEKGHRIDMAIFWFYENNPYSLFVEHKIESFPWEQESSEGIKETQIDAYCKYQELKNMDSEKRNFVSLFSKVLVKGHSKDQKRFACYLGNYTWSDLVSLLVKDISSEGIALLRNELANFMRRNDMAGFENFRLSELSSIKPYKDYKEKRNSLILHIIGYLKKNMELTLLKKSHDFKITEAWGEDTKHKRYGVFLHEGKNLDQSGVWIIFGISEAAGDQWTLEPTYSQELIPDVECAVYFWFESEKEMKKLMDDLNITEKSWIREENRDFELNTLRKKNYWLLTFIKKRSLLDFVGKDFQERDIINFLQDGLNELLVSGRPIRRSINRYLQK